MERPERLQGWRQKATQKAIRKLFPIAERAGVHLSPVHFYHPIPDTRQLTSSLLEARSAMPGVEMNEAGQEALAAELARFGEEFATFGDAGAADGDGFGLGNESFDWTDAQVLHGMLRLHRPRLMVEIGSGWSTLLSHAALSANAREGSPGELVAIEPYPRPMLDALEGAVRLIPRPVQEVPFEEFERLDDGDVLFIDSSHVLRLDSDVRHEYLEILPRLKPGVFVHVHDVFLPQHYPRQWMFDEGWFWNEQYLLQAFLAFNAAFEVLWAGSWLHHHRPDVLATHLRPAPADFVPGSFWMRRVR